jgi:hypothetical protein
MSAIAGIGGVLLWVLVLSFPLAIYMLVTMVRSRSDLTKEDWADLRPVDFSGRRKKESLEERIKKKKSA